MLAKTIEEVEERYGYGFHEVLGRTLRPTICAPEGKILIWGDLKQIEARVNPWLANSQGGDEKLDIFRSGRDLYIDAAARILKRPYESFTKESPERQKVGKVAELALGFAGGVGSLFAFGYEGTEVEAQEIVHAWREVNAWAPDFWKELEEAVKGAYWNPGEEMDAGMLTYKFLPNRFEGTMTCTLPSGRRIRYPFFRLEVDELGKQEFTYQTAKGSSVARGRLWRGILIENATQATAADLLRHAIKRLVHEGWKVVLHTHDELCIETTREMYKEAKAALTAAITDNPWWADGLPLGCDIKAGEAYGK